MTNKNNIDVEYLGYRLLERGFRVWFLYMFQLIEGRKFIVEPLHEQLFNYFQDIYDQKIKRSNVNLSPRSAKTTVSIYFVAFCMTLNPRCNFIYTSFSQILLGDISRQLMNIFEHPAYKAMYSNYTNLENLEANPISDFWKDYLIDNEHKATYTSKKITTAQGGIILLNAMGSAITGMGAGIRNSKGFTGAIIIDDANKPSDTNSQVMLNNVKRYFEETLLSRLNNPNVAIINVQQRLCLSDLSGFLIEKYNYNTLKLPLLVDGVCQLPSQYTEERIKELQLNSYMFEAQYMQSPQRLGGNIIKSEWFNYYQELPNQFERLFIAADTALKAKKVNDFSVFGVWGKYAGNLYLIDLVRGKWESPELLEVAKNLVQRYRLFCNCRLSEFLIEDEASGIGLIQHLKRDCQVPIRPVQVNRDKVSRVQDALPFIANGYVHLPYNRNYGFNVEFLNECEAFSADMVGHDDQVDVLSMSVNYVSQTISIYDCI